jgi:hypothetical protein
MGTYDAARYKNRCNMARKKLFVDYGLHIV